MKPFDRADSDMFVRVGAQAAKEELLGISPGPGLISRSPDRLTLMYLRGAAQFRARKQAEEERAARREEAEMAECTFQPRINESSKSMNSPRMMRDMSFLDRQ
eukprot:scaffold127752_cov46-Prasinocladus_malaysianus.AAC.1